MTKYPILYYGAPHTAIIEAAHRARSERGRGLIASAGRLSEKSIKKSSSYRKHILFKRIDNIHINKMYISLFQLFTENYTEKAFKGLLSKAKYKDDIFNRRCSVRFPLLLCGVVLCRVFRSGSSYGRRLPPSGHLLVLSGAPCTFHIPPRSWIHAS